MTSLQKCFPKWEQAGSESPVEDPFMETNIWKRLVPPKKCLSTSASKAASADVLARTTHADHHHGQVSLVFWLQIGISSVPIHIDVIMSLREGPRA